MKYKVGDKVVVLPSAEHVQVSKCSINKAGTISSVPTRTDCWWDYLIRVKCDNDSRVHSCNHLWYVKEEHIKFYNQVGKQLEFSFMEDV